MKMSIAASIRRLFPGGGDSAALQGASVSVQSIHHEPCVVPEASHFLIEAVITPSVPDVSWKLDELTLLPPQAAELARRGESAEDLCRVMDVQVLREGGFRSVSDYNVAGAAHVRMRVIVRNGLRLFRFRYRDVLFGQLVLPTGQVENY